MIVMTLLARTRADIEAELAAECYRAKREMPRLGTWQHPTPWDVRHADLDLLLTQWQAST